ncbi:MAG: GNAT family N-acetyltransferase [Campylobacterales bacterium]|nr:GNAT family N-acetyltransferase [Campylobacterales bacterium]
MQPLYLQTLRRADYIDAIAQIDDAPTRRFADQALAWWDRHYSWRDGGCVALCDVQGVHLCYLFSVIDRYHDYLSIHNLFTPYAMRRHGYAKVLLSLIFDRANALHVKRFRLTGISESLDFYLSLGCLFWGVTHCGDYYCDLPMPTSGLEGLDASLFERSNALLLGSRAAAIFAKLDASHAHLSAAKQALIEADCLKMESRYRYTSLRDFNAFVL